MTTRQRQLLSAATITIALIAGAKATIARSPDHSLYVSVLDGDRPVVGLTAANFELSVDRQPRTFTLATPELPSVAIVAENTLHLQEVYGRYVPLAFEELTRVAPYMGQYMLGTLGRRFATTVPFTYDIASFENAYRNTLPGSAPPPLWDGLYRTTELLDERRGRHAVIVLASGDDASREHTFDDLLTRLERTDVAMFLCGIGTGDTPVPEQWILMHGNQHGDPRLRLRMLAEASGGGAWFPLGQFGVRGAMRDVVLRLDSEYRLVYSSDVAPDDRVHTVTVRAYRVRPDGSRQSLRVIARSSWRFPAT